MSPKKIYFLGIAGTGMASAAGLCQEAGFEVIGSDNQIYPPMSTMLANLKIPVLTPYSPENIIQNPCDLYVVGNSLSKNHPEVEQIVRMEKKLTSFPQFIGEEILKKRFSIVVAGTHGKTTTSSLLTHILRELGQQPGYLIGGIPQNFSTSFALGQGPAFVIEGDEYDTAFFDKESKFLHYKPQMVVLNNIEFDHADIFPDLAAIEAMFTKLLKLVKNPSHIIANGDDPGVQKLLSQLNLWDRVTLTGQKTNQVKLRDIKSTAPLWSGVIENEVLGTFDLTSQLTGNHNWSNIAQCVGAISQLVTHQLITKPKTEDLIKAIHDFRGVKRRLELLGTKNDITIYEDFAHHPTAVREVINGFRHSFPKKRLIVAFEPKNATSRRNIFTENYAKEFKAADIVLIGACTKDSRIQTADQMDTQELAKKIGDKAKAFEDNQDLYQWLRKALQPGDSVIFMSSGSFSGIHTTLAHELNSGLI